MQSWLSTPQLGVPAFVARPDQPGDYPCVVVLHERYGLVEHTMNTAIRIAGSGYVAIAPNLYFEHPDQEGLKAGIATARVTDERALRILDDVVECLRSVDGADPGRLALLGACATGRYPVLFGANRHLDACVVFHGLYANREWEPDGEFHTEPMKALVSRLEAPLLGLFGELDHLISVEDVRFIRDNFESSDKSYRIVLYAGAPHGWTDNTMPGRYRHEASEAAWTELLGFLDRHLASIPPAQFEVEWHFSLAKSRDYDFATNIRRE